jgi:ubiquinone/menaquinone biosynthesis C-methylase UbiE
MPAVSLAAALILLPVGLNAQSEHPISGRRIAPVMGLGGADWLQREEREREELPETALDVMGVRAGMAVGDVGAGTGYFSLRMARRVGPKGHVYANDIQPEMLDMLRERAEKEKLGNVETVLGQEADPKLPANRLDLVLMVDVYHELSQPQVMLRKVRESLKSDGRLVIIEYRKEDPHIPIRPEHKMSVAEVKAEVEAEGFRLLTVSKQLPRQHLIIFGKSVQ